MNVLLVMIGLRVWSAPPLQIVTRVLLAISLVSLEMQFITWTGLGTFRSLVLPNAGLAALLLWWTSRSRPPRAAMDDWRAHARYLVPAALALGAVVAVLNNTRALTPADPYHLERAERIEHLGTIAYDPAVDRNDPRLNTLNWLYEFLLVDVGNLPVVGTLAVRNHGLLGLALYSMTAWSILILLKVPPQPLGVMLFAVPLVYHQFVLIKNDLLGAIPSALVLTWVVGRLRDAPPREFLWAGWLAGLAVSIKLTSFPVAVVLTAASFMLRREARPLGMLVAGGMAGALAGGLVFTLVENARMYGSAFAPLMAVNGRPTGLVDALVSVARFAISLVDLGVLTRVLWPMGGWGGTYGLPVIWALVVLAVAARRAPEAKQALWLVGVFWLLSASTNIDIGTNHRYVLAPGLTLVGVAVSLASREDLVPAWLRRSAVAIVLLSALQILRSASLYLVRL